MGILENEGVSIALPSRRLYAGAEADNSGNGGSFLRQES
jgi:hypothetical protein